MDSYAKLESQFKDLARLGKISEALNIGRRAHKLYPNEKLKRRIEKLETYFAEHGDALPEEDSDMVHVGKGFYLYKELHSKLYPYQIEGILWLWALYKRKKGGILGDDMGLGKTIQVIAFLSGLFDLEEIQHVMIVVPVSLIPNWKKEFDKWAPGLRVRDFYGSNKKERERHLNKVRKDGGILITSYGLLVSCCENFSRNYGKEFVWDYMILDEGHKIKNPTKTTKAAHEVSARHRIVLSGTPLQNNLRELWALFDFAHHGTLLGTAKTFKMEFETPITRAREKDATVGERKLGQQIAESLHRVIKPYFLRRTKADVLENNKENEKPKDMPSLTRKNDLIIWLPMSSVQIPIYKDFLQLDRVKEILMTKRSPLVELTVLKKICDHPRLLSRKACIQLGLDLNVDGEDLNEDELEEISSKMSIDHVEDEVLIEESGKMQFLLKLLSNLKREGHRTLVFSLSRKILDIIERILKNLNQKVLRLDGTITKPEERQKIINKFQNEPSYSFMLLTTQVGGVGLTLTAADRVVIYDPSWNPATDAQAVDRVYRIGQQKTVIIYRLITCGTVEEKIYRRQVFKDSLTKLTTGDEKNPYRYFTKQELRELFTLDNPSYSKTQIQLKELHRNQRKTDKELEKHIDFLHTLGIFGISDHDLMFNSKIKDEEEDHQELEEGEDYIQDRVARAQQIIKLETDLIKQKTIETGRYKGPIELNYVKPPLMKIYNEDLDNFDLNIQSESILEDSMKDLSIHEIESNTSAFQQHEKNTVKSHNEISAMISENKFITVEESDNESLITSFNNSDCKILENKDRNIEEEPIIIEESEEEYDHEDVIKNRTSTDANERLSVSTDVIAESGSPKRLMEAFDMIEESDDDYNNTSVNGKRVNMDVSGEIEDSSFGLIEDTQPDNNAKEPITQETTDVGIPEVKISPNFKACMDTLLSLESMPTPKDIPGRRKSLAKRKSFVRYKSIESDFEGNESDNNNNNDDDDDLSLKNETPNRQETEDSHHTSSLDKSSNKSVGDCSSSFGHSSIGDADAEFEDSSSDEDSNKKSVRKSLSDRTSRKLSYAESSDNSPASNANASNLSAVTPTRKENLDSPFSIKKRPKPINISDDDDDTSVTKVLDADKYAPIETDSEDSESQHSADVSMNNSTDVSMNNSADVSMSNVQNTSSTSKKVDLSSSFTSNEMSFVEGEETETYSTSANSKYTESESEDSD